MQPGRAELYLPSGGIGGVCGGDFGAWGACGGCGGGFCRPSRQGNSGRNHGRQCDKQRHPLHTNCLEAFTKNDVSQAEGNNRLHDGHSWQRSLQRSRVKSRLLQADANNRQCHQQPEFPGEQELDESVVDIGIDHRLRQQRDEAVQPAGCRAEQQGLRVLASGLRWLGCHSCWSRYLRWSRYSCRYWATELQRRTVRR